MSTDLEAQPQTGAKEGLRLRFQQQEDTVMERLATSLQDLTSNVNPPVPNPAPLGLFGFGFTTALLQVKHTRLAGDSADDLHGVNTVVLGFAMFFGGLMQLIAGVSEIRRNNLFGYTAFTLYAAFWMSYAFIFVVALWAPREEPPINGKAIQAMLFMLGMVTVMFWTLTFTMNKTICLLFGLLSVTCALLVFGVENETIDEIGGWFGMVTSANAFWLAYVELVNDVYGKGKKEIIPLGHWKNKTELNEAHVGAAHHPGRIHGSHHGSRVYQQQQQQQQQNEDSNGGIAKTEATDA